MFHFEIHIKHMSDFKLTERKTIDDQWIALLVVGIITIISSIIIIFVLSVLWLYYHQHGKQFQHRNSTISRTNGIRKISVQIGNQQIQHYETQVKTWKQMSGSMENLSRCTKTTLNYAKFSALMARFSLTILTIN